MENLANLIADYSYVSNFVGYVSPQELLTAIADAPENGFETTVSSYSGRGMYGRECLSISGSEEELKDILQTALIVASAYSYMTGNLSTVRDLQECLLSQREDSLGYDKVYYFTDVGFETPEEESDDAEEEE